MVSYVPNNAYLVQVSASGAQRIAAFAGTQAVLPWEPYYKLSPSLLKLAVEKQNPPEATLLNVLAFPGHADEVKGAINDLNGELLGEDRSPFGQQLVVKIPGSSFLSVAQMPGVQIIEPYQRRVPMNDLTRSRVRVSTNTTTAANYRGLTGNGVIVSVNDTGVDGGHPDLTGRVTAYDAATLSDPAGHGTHVSGIIASTGANGPNPGTKARGSTNGASFRGMAPAAKLHVLPIDLVTGPVGESFLQEGAVATNAFISNNSWGYPGAYDYTLASMSWDAAVRDALPSRTGPQPFLPVFAAGNSGGGNDAGDGGSIDTVSSPGNAKNVITVGSIEQFRRITNNVIVDGETNRPFFAMTDSSNQVSSFSSRGNVSIGVEGEWGRFKPDVVAPGSFVVSTRPRNWTRSLGGTNFEVNLRTNVVLRPRQTNIYSAFIPPDGYQLRVTALANPASPSPFLPILIKINQGAPPDANNGTLGTNDLTVNVSYDTWYFSVVNTNSQAINFDVRTIIVTTNNPGNYYQELANLDAELSPAPYGYESGTSMAAPVVSGLLALIQQGFRDDLSITNASPALFKALLINGARSVNSKYDFRVNSLANYQGWGLVNITNSYPESLQSGFDRNTGGMLFFDQASTNALSTGQSETRVVRLSSAATRVPMRVTLVWTDPPGNAAVATKLVNDLDLIVTNLDSGEVFVGNNFDEGSVFTSGISGTATNGTNVFLPFDNINNVENVYLQSTFTRSLGTNYSITVVARRVDVNAITTKPDGIFQDYALVVSSASPTLPGAITLSADSIVENPSPHVTVVTNGVPLLNQKVGANSPYLVTTNGNTNQWSFFIFTNAPAGTNGPGNQIAGPYVAFHTFLPPNLSILRTSQEADIDMFVSKDPAITNLNLTAIQGSTRGLKRLGSETVILTNSSIGDVFYVGIKSEDQMASSFGFFAVSSDKPFSSRDADGNIIATAYPLSADVPDGSPQTPEAALLFAFVMEPVIVDNVIVTNVITHDSGGDLFGHLGHDGQFAVLNNHQIFNGTKMFIYDESDSGEILPSQVVDGPGSLRDFVGQPGEGAWQLTMIDNSQFHTGRVDQLTIKIRPQPDNLGAGVVRRILPNRWTFTTTNVPPDATKLIVCASPTEGPVEVYIRRESFPDQGNYDGFATISPPGDCISIGRNDSPPLSQGLYIIGIYNPNSFPVNVRFTVNVERNFTRGLDFQYKPGESIGLLDDAKTNGVIFVDRHQLIADVSVGVRIDHPQVSDLSLHLISPQGVRILLGENRGGLATANFGVTAPLVTNVFDVNSAGGFEAASNILDLASPFGTLEVDYDFFGIPDDLRVYYDGELIFDSGLVSFNGTFSVDFGPGFSTNLVLVMNEGDNPDQGTAWGYTARVITGGNMYFTFTENTNLAHLPIKFLQPPFTTNMMATNPATLTSVSTFESVAAATYAPGNIFEGWKVLGSNSVDVLRSTNLALNSTQFLATAAGVVTRSLPTVAGREYRLIFGKRDQCQVGLWRGEGNAADEFGLNNGITSGALAFVPGEVGQAFSFNGLNSEIQFNPSPSLNVGAGEGFTIECWIKPTGVQAQQPLVEWTGGPFNDQVHLWISVTDMFGGGGPGDLYVNVFDTTRTAHQIASPAGLIQPNVFQHVAVTYDKPSGVVRLFRNGVIIRTVNLGSGLTPLTTAPMYVGVRPSGERYSGLMDELGLYACALSPSEIKAIYDAGSAGKCDASGCGPRGQIVVGNSTNDIRGIANWASQSIEFAATGTVSMVTLIGGGASAVRVDNFELLAKADDPTLYVLPEEPLSALKGQDAYGDWKLEVWDTRLNVAVTNGSLVSWQLKFQFVNTNYPAITLTNGQCYSGALPINETAYFVLNVPTLAAHATNHLTSSGSSILYFNSNGLPAGVLFNQSSILLSNVPDGTAIVGTNGTRRVIPSNPPTTAALPVLPKGKYYLGVSNTDTNSTTNAFTLCVNFDRVTTNLLQVIQLTNRIAYTNVVQSTNLLDYYQYDASSNAVRLIFEVLKPTDWVDLVIKRGLPLPNLNSFEYLGTSLDPDPTKRATNQITIDLTDPTSQSLAGRWYLGVADLTNAPVSYAVRVTEIFGIDPVPLTNGVGVTTNTAGTNVDYYVFNVSSNAYRADFEILSPNGNVDLFIRTGPTYPPPGSSNFFYRSINAGTANELITVTTNSTPFPLVPGNWYLAVENNEITPTTYTVRVTEYLNPTIITLTNGVAYTNTVATASTNNVDYYRFVVSPGAVEAVFEVLLPTGDVSLFTGRTFLDVALRQNVVSSTQPGAADEQIVRLPGSAVLPLTPGEWYLAVTNETGAPVTYAIRASEVLGREIVHLTNAVPFSRGVAASTSTNRGIDYYWFTVSPGAYQAIFETFGASGDVDIFVTKGLPLPDTNAPYASRNPGAAPEKIIVTTNSNPIVLSAGDWFVAVYNRDPAPVNYTIRAFELLPPPIIRLTNGFLFNNVVKAPNGTTNLGVDYYVFTVSTNAVEAKFETLNASGNVDLYISKGLPLPSDTNFVYASTNLLATNEFIAVAQGQSPVGLTPGDWYLAVYSREAVDVSYSVVAMEIVASDIVTLTNCIGYAASVPANGSRSPIAYYRFVVDTNAIQANFEVLNPSADVRLSVRKGLPLPYKGDTAYYSNNSGLVNESILVTNNAPVFPLTPGDWYLSVENDGLSAMNFTVRVSEIALGNNLVVLTNGAGYTSSATPCPAGETDYYLFNVSGTAQRVQFDILSPSDNVNLVIRKGLPLPTTSSRDYASSNPGTNDELIIVTTGSTPVGLTAGDWYVGVVHTSLNPVTYTVKATESTVPGTNIFINSYILSTNALCITWTNTLPGGRYFVQGKVDLTDTNWVPVSPTITAPGSQASYCIPLPTTNRFFRVAEGLSGFTSVEPVETGAMYAQSPVLPLNQMPSAILDPVEQFLPASLFMEHEIQLSDLESQAERAGPPLVASVPRREERIRL